jgi:transposase
VQGGDGELRDGDAAVGAGGLGGDELESAVDALDGLADSQDTAVEVDVVVVQAEDLAASEAGGEGEDEDGFESFGGGVVEEASGLVEVEGASVGGADAGSSDDLGDVAGDEVEAFGVAERGPQDAVNLGEGGGGDLVAAGGQLSRAGFDGGCRPTLEVVIMVAPRKYPEDLRERAIRLVLDAKADPDGGPDGGSAKGACRRVGDQLGISPETLRGWVARAEIDAGARPGTTSEDALRIAALEKENRELRRANAILRSASAFFAAELDRP